MNRCFAKNLFFVALVFAAGATFSCGKKGAEGASILKREDLFTLDYGNFENEINMFSFADSTKAMQSISSSLTMRDGFFYIANAEAKKIMRLNSYGDLLSLYYNPASNPLPFSDFSASTAADAVSAQRGIPYQFNSISGVALDSQRRMYVVDTLPLDRQEYDADEKLNMGQIVLLFSGDGIFLDYLGQHGPRGTPFPPIERIYVTKNDELVVICASSTGMKAYWFSSDCSLLYVVPIESVSLLNPFFSIGGGGGGGKNTATAGDETFCSFKTLFPDYSGRRLYAVADFYKNIIDASTHTQSEIEYLGTALFPVDIDTGAISESITIPSYSDVNGKIPYNFLGQTETSWFFFSTPDKTGYTLQILHPTTQRVIKRHIDVDYHNLEYYAFALSTEGILSAMLASEENVLIAWWRTDSFVDSLLNN
ncbi:MAG: lipoprotein [Treponemataceae bacterium]|nr:MAG: lipoprotein [Treponemataceae bacterium]